MSAACRLSGTRGSPIAPSRMASKPSCSILMVPGGRVTPVFRYLSAPQSNGVMRRLLPAASATVVRALTASAMTSTPMPSPGTTAMCKGPAARATCLVGEGAHHPAQDHGREDEGRESEEPEAQAAAGVVPEQGGEHRGHEEGEYEEDEEVAGPPGVRPTAGTWASRMPRPLRSPPPTAQGVPES